MRRPTLILDADAEPGCTVDRGLLTHGLERNLASLPRLGANHEGVLRKSFLRDGEYLDQVLWTILVDDWRLAKLPPNAY